MYAKAASKDTDLEAMPAMETIDEDDDVGFKPHLVETEEEWKDEEELE